MESLEFGGGTPATRRHLAGKAGRCTRDWQWLAYAWKLEKGADSIWDSEMGEKKWEIMKKGGSLAFEEDDDVIHDVSTCDRSWASDWLVEFTIKVDQAILKPISKFLHFIFNFDTFNPQFYPSIFVKHKFIFQTEYSYYSSKPAHH